MKKIILVLGFGFIFSWAGLAQAALMTKILPLTASSSISTKTVEVTPVPVSLPANIKERIQLNPQPEPPAPVNLQTNITVVKTKTETENGKINKNAKLERSGLNPQPEPPMPQTGSVMGTSSSVKIDSGLQVQGTKILVVGSTTGSTTEFKLKTALPAFYNMLNLALRKQKASTTIEGLDLKLVDGQPAYEIQTTENAKLFGLIPLKLKTKTIIAADTDKVKKVIRPWYGSFASVVDWSNIKLLPNLNITKVTVTAPDGGIVVEGQPARITAEIINDGATYLFIGPPILSGAPRMDFYAAGNWLGAYVPVMFLKPGEKVAFDYNWDVAKCGAEVKVTAALITDFPEEATKDDNTAITTVSCGQ